MKLGDLEPGMYVQARIPAREDEFRPVIRGEVVEVGVGYDTEDVFLTNLAGRVAERRPRRSEKNDGVSIRVADGRVRTVAARSVERLASPGEPRYVAADAPWGTGIYDAVAGTCVHHKISRARLWDTLARLNAREGADT